jgi:hypothetical protein
LPEKHVYRLPQNVRYDENLQCDFCAGKVVREAKFYDSRKKEITMEFQAMGYF